MSDAHKEHPPGNPNDPSTAAEVLAKKVFLVTIASALAYVGIVFLFVL
jgi:hypothetical protein